MRARARVRTTHARTYARTYTHVRARARTHARKIYIRKKVSDNIFLNNYLYVCLFIVFPYRGLQGFYQRERIQISSYNLICLSTLTYT